MEGDNPEWSEVAGVSGRRRPHCTRWKEADVLGLATASWIALVTGVVVALVIALIYTRE